jgi:hypothetical protein
MPNYWSYWQMGANGWEYSVIAADRGKVTDSAVNAWSWGTGNPPALITFQNTCEGVAFVLPTSTPPTDTPEPTAAATIASATLAPIATPTPVGTQNTPGSYIVYASILLVLGVLIIYLFRSRRK